MADPVVQSLVGARVTLLFDDPWYGNMVTRLELIEHPEASELQASYREMRYDRTYVASLPPAELVVRMRSLIDALVAGLDCSPSTDDEATQRSEFIAAIINANIAVGHAPTNRIGHLVQLAP